MNKMWAVLAAVAGMAMAAPASAEVSKTRGSATLCESAKAAVIHYLTADKSGKVYLKGQGNGWGVDPPNNLHKWFMTATTNKAGLPGDVRDEALTVTTPLLGPTKYGFALVASAKHKKAISGATLCEFFRKNSVKDWSQVKKADLLVGDVWDVKLLEMGTESAQIGLTPNGAVPAGASAQARVYVIITDQYSESGFNMQVTLSAVK